jgi:CheY-like chemotaxis protein
LGLSVVHGIVEAYDGHITVESAPAEGTVFRIYFPVTKQVPTPVVAPQPAAPVVAAEPQGGVVLLVDDEAVVLKVTRTILERLGYTVEGHTDALAAAAAVVAAPEHYRLLLTDFSMPKIDGVELARRVWEVRPELPAILYTGYGGRLTASEAEQMGFTELLAKPFTMQKLAEAVAHALQGPEPATVGGA